MHHILQIKWLHKKNLIKFYQFLILILNGYTATYYLFLCDCYSAITQHEQFVPHYLDQCIANQNLIAKIKIGGQFDQNEYVSTIASSI